MSSRYGERGYGRYGDREEDRTEDRYERGGDYGPTRRGLPEGARGGYGRGSGREYERDYEARDLGGREYGARRGAGEYGAREYGARYGREGLGGGSARRYAGEEYGRESGPRPYGREYGRDHVRPRPYERDDDEVHEYDTDYGRTTSRFYGRSGYEYGRDDYDDRAAYGRRGRDDRDDDDEREGRGGNWLDRAADQVRSWFGGDDDDRDDVRRVGDPRGAYGRGEGKFRGLGPKNYRRPDERVREEVCDRLTENAWLDASDVEVNVAAGEVILTGSVDSRYAKRLAESIAESVTGVQHVQNNLRVQSYQATTPEVPLHTPTGALTAGAASDITATSDTTAVAPHEPGDLNATDHPSSRAAGRS